MGGNLKFIFTIGSELPHNIANELQCILNVKIIKFYGLKETIGPVMYNIENNEPYYIQIKNEIDCIIKEYSVKDELSDSKINYLNELFT